MGTGGGWRFGDRLRVLVLAGLASLVVAIGAAPRAEAQVPTEGRYIDPVFAEVEVTEDIAYREAVNVDGELQTLHLDLYEPAGDTAPQRPAIVLIHGGYFVFGNNKQDTWGAGPFIAGLFARRGYVVASIQYRLRPDMGLFPNVDLAELEAAGFDAHDDALAAVDWLREHRAEHRIDPRAIVPNGPSAGGAVAWGLAWMQGSSARPQRSGVPAAISVSGAPLETSFVTGEPLAAPSPGDPPVLAIHGTADNVVPFALAEGPCLRAATVGVRCDLFPLDGIGHPGLDPRFFDHLEAIEERTFAFLAEVVLAPLGYFGGEVTAPTAPPPPPAVPVVGEPAFTG